jgi:hypothetical protein
MVISANKKRSEGPDLRKGDKVYLWRRNIRTKRLSNKLDFLKLGVFEIEDKKGPVNYKLKLPKGMRIHPVFYVSLLEPAYPDAPLDQSTELDGDRLEPEYEVESILDHAVYRRQHKYLVKWKGYPTEENTWEPKSNLQNSLQLLADYYRAHPTKPSLLDPTRRKYPRR